MKPNDKTKEQLFIMDFINALLDQANIAQVDVINHQNTPEEGFNVGVVQGYWQVLSSLVSRMKIHELDLTEYNLEKYDPDSIWIMIRANLSKKKQTPTDNHPQTRFSL
jgi:hypothetical protein